MKGYEVKEMSSVTHEEILQTAINTIKKQGFRVIRLDRRKVPDAIAIKNDEVVAIEANTNPTNVWLTRRAYEIGTSQYDAELIATKPYSKHYHAHEEYLLALELRKQGMSYPNMSRVLQEKYGRGFCLSLLHDWCNGNARPLGI